MKKLFFLILLIPFFAYAQKTVSPDWVKARILDSLTVERATRATITDSLAEDIANIIVTPEQFGAISNDSTVDNSVAFNLMFASDFDNEGDLDLNYRRGIVVKLKDNSIYYTKHTIYLYPHIIFEGNNSLISYIGDVGDSLNVIENYWSDTDSLITPSIDLEWGVNGFRIKDLHIEGNDVAKVGIYMPNAVESSILNVKVTGCTDGIVLENVQYSNFTNIILFHNLRDGLVLKTLEAEPTLRCIENTFINVISGWNGRDGIRLSSAIANYFGGCSVGRNERNDLRIDTLGSETGGLISNTFTQFKVEHGYTTDAIYIGENVLNTTFYGLTFQRDADQYYRVLNNYGGINTTIYNLSSGNGALEVNPNVADDYSLFTVRQYGGLTLINPQIYPEFDTPYEMASLDSSVDAGMPHPLYPSGSSYFNFYILNSSGGFSTKYIDLTMPDNNGWNLYPAIQTQVADETYPRFKILYDGTLEWWDGDSSSAIASIDMGTGILLDSLKGEAIVINDVLVGSEEIINGVFADSTIWGVGENWIITGGEANHDTTTIVDIGNFLDQQNVFLPNHRYRVTYTVSNFDGTSVGCGGNVTYLEPLRTANGTYTTDFVYTSNIGTDSSIYFVGLGELTIDNLSVKELLPSLVLQGDSLRFGNNNYATAFSVDSSGNGYFAGDLTVDGTINGEGAGGGTVTSVAAITLGTTGTDLSSTVANGTTTPVITLQVPTASATNRGALSSTDWSTFNNKPDSDAVNGLIGDWADTTSSDTSAYTMDEVDSLLALVGKVQTHTITTDSTLAADLMYGGIFYVTEAQTITLPAVAEGMNAVFITVGNVAVSIDVNGSDLMYLDGTALSDGDKATNTSTTGDMIVFTYFSSVGWYATSGSNDGDRWTDGN